MSEEVTDESAGCTPAPALHPVRLCAVSDMEPLSAKRIDVNGERIAVVRLEGEDFRAIGDRCSHADFSLAEGDVDAEECTLECWKHGSQFSLETGVPVTLPAVKAVPVYEVVVRESEVFVMLPGGDDDE